MGAGAGALQQDATYIGGDKLQHQLTGAVEQQMYEQRHALWVSSCINKVLGDGLRGHVRTKLLNLEAQYRGHCLQSRQSVNERDAVNA